MFKYTETCKVYKLQEIEGIDNFIDTIKMKSREGNPMYEYYTSIQEVKPFLDIDYKSKNQEEVIDFENNCKTPHFRNRIMTIVNDTFGFDIPKENYTFMYSNKIVVVDNIYKYGLHITIKGYKSTSPVLKKYFTTMKEQINILCGGNVLDISVYKEKSKKFDTPSQGIFRLPLVIKDKKQDNIYIPFETELSQDCLLTYTEKDDILIPDFIEVKKSDFKKECVKYTIKKNLIPMDDLEECLDNTTPPDDYISWRNSVWSLMSGGISFEKINEWSKKGSNYDFKVLELVCNSYRDGFFTIGTFIYLVLKKNNPELFNKIYETYLSNYTEMKEVFEKEWCKVIDGDFYYNIPKQQKVSSHTLSGMYSHYEKVGNTPFIKYWMEDTNVRVYQNMDFLPFPLECPEDTINLYQIPDKTKQLLDNYKEYNPNDFQHNYTELLKCLCNNNEEIFGYCMKFIYHLLMYPGIKPKVSICFKSPQGVGKNLFWEHFIGNLIGKQYVSCSSNPEQIFGRFSTFRLQKLLMIFNESKVLYSKSDTLKEMITDDTYKYEQKGLTEVTLRCCGRTLFFSNNDFPIHIEDNDRRYVYIDTEKVPDMDFGYLYNQGLENELEYLGFLEDLMNYQVPDDYNFKEHRPITEEYTELQEVQGYSVEHHWYDDLMYRIENSMDEKFKMMFQFYNPDEPDENKLFRDNGSSLEQLHFDFRNFIKEHYPNYKTNPKSFSMIIGNKLQDKIMKKKISKNNKMITLYLLLK